MINTKQLKDEVDKHLKSGKVVCGGENKTLAIVPCLICSKGATFEVPTAHGFGFTTLSIRASSELNWQITMRDSKIFLCCPECIDEAYDENGRLGFLKEKYFYLMKDFD